MIKHKVSSILAKSAADAAKPSKAGSAKIPRKDDVHGAITLDFACD